MKKSSVFFIFKLLALWLAFLFIIFLVAIRFVPVQSNFLGGGYENYIKAPLFWVWGNFDGQHYESIAQNGYGFGEKAFFPLYPLLIRFVGQMFGGTLISYNIVGVLISWVSIFFALLGLYNLVEIDFNNKVAKLAVILTLFFPTSFYFASVYTESIFFAFAIWAFYFARKGKWLYATIFGILLTATRFVGLIILPSIVVEWFLQNYKKEKWFKNFPDIILAIPTGLLAYMYYLDRNFHNMFAFYSDLSTFGEQRSSHLITLPQVFYRYVFKILPSINYNYLPILYTTSLEFIFGAIYLLISIVTLIKSRLSYALFICFGYLVPTFSGSFSSLPRYVLVLFPVYILLASFLEKRRKILFAFLIFSIILLIISFSLFSRGYWLS